MWTAVWLSPDGRTLLAEWSVECDGRHSFFVPAHGGPPRPVTGEGDWRRSPHSWPRGWDSGGRARVWVFAAGGCGGGDAEPGRYLIDPRTGALEFVAPLPAAYGT